MHKSFKKLILFIWIDRFFNWRIKMILEVVTWSESLFSWTLFSFLQNNLFKYEIKMCFIFWINAYYFELNAIRLVWVMRSASCMLHLLFLVFLTFCCCCYFCLLFLLPFIISISKYTTRLMLSIRINLYFGLFPYPLTQCWCAWCAKRIHIGATDHQNIGTTKLIHCP